MAMGRFSVPLLCGLSLAALLQPLDSSVTLPLAGAGVASRVKAPSPHVPRGSVSVSLHAGEEAAGGESAAGSLLASLHSLAAESLDSEGCLLSDAAVQDLASEIKTLIGDNEALQRAVMRRMTQDRATMMMCAREQDGEESLLLPLDTVIRTAEEECNGERRNSAAPIYAGSHASERPARAGVAGNMAPEKEPPFVPHRRARDDILSAKLLALLDAGASVLHEAAAVSNATQQLQDAVSSAADATGKTEAPPAMGPAEVADALVALAAGEGRRRADAAIRDGLRPAEDAALLHALRGGGVGAGAGAGARRAAQLAGAGTRCILLAGLRGGWVEPGDGDAQMGEGEEGGAGAPASSSDLSDPDGSVGSSAGSAGAGGGAGAWIEKEMYGVHAEQRAGEAAEGAPPPGPLRELPRLKHDHMRAVQQVPSAPSLSY